MLSNRLNASEEYIYKGFTDDSQRLITCRNSPTNINDKIKARVANDKKMKRNISEDSKSSARGSKNSRRNDDKGDSLKRKTGNQMNLIYKELLSLKAEYKILKDSYNLLIREKVETNKTAGSSQGQIARLQAQNNELNKQNETMRSQVQFLQKQLERIKKESMKLLEVEDYRMKKLEENLKEKDRIIASRNNSSLSFFNEDAVLTEAKDYSNIVPKGISILSYRDRYTSINTEIVEQKLVYRNEQEPTIECTLQNITNRGENQRNYSSQSSISSLGAELAHKTRQFEAFKKRTPLDTLNDCKSPNQKKKRSITNGKILTTGKKKTPKTAIGKPRKLNNQTFR